MELETDKPDVFVLGFASWKDGSFELIVRSKNGASETTLKGQLEKGQFEVLGTILPTCVFVDATADTDGLGPRIRELGIEARELRDEVGNYLNLEIGARALRIVKKLAAIPVK